MKMTKIVSLVLVIIMAATCLLACGDNGKTEGTKYELTMWVSTTTDVDKFTLRMIDEFKAAHPEYNFTVTIEKVGEDNAATEVLKDVKNAPDIYCFAQDQISRLVQQEALAPLGVAASETVKKNNDAGSVAAATVGDEIYAYPMTSDNGYYLYYDKRIVSDEQAKTFDGIIAACQAAGVKFGVNYSSGFYTAGFFFSQEVGGNGEPLCSSAWEYSADGKNPIKVTDTFNSNNGLVAMKMIQSLASNKIIDDNSSDFEGTGAVISGIWKAGAAELAYGDYMKATKLPTFEVGGKTYQMGSFSGYKYVGCKMQTDDMKAKLCADLALWLTSEDVQMERYYEFQWGPSNVNAQQHDDVKDNALLKALAAQNKYAQQQGVIPNDWWTEVGALGKKCTEAGLTDADLLAALQTYNEKINKMIVK